MISLQRSMHSSQMYTPGPAISFLTCFCDFPQNEHFNRSESPNLAMLPCSLDSLANPGHPEDPNPRSLRRLRREGSQFGLNLPAGDHLVDDSVFLGLLARHDEVSIGVR